VSPLLVVWLPKVKVIDTDEDVEYIRSVNRDAIEKLLVKIEKGVVNKIYLIGANVCTGWKMKIKRQVSFVYDKPGKVFDDNFIACEDQAAVRITHE
jgi:hypothetical protein